MLAEITWQEVDAKPLILSWQTLTAMASVASIIVSVAVVYLRLFVENRLSDLRGALIESIQKATAEGYLGKHVGDLLELRLKQIESRLIRLEDEP